MTCTSTVIEWDNDVPPYPILVGELEQAQASSMRVRQNLAEGSRDGNDR